MSIVRPTVNSIRYDIQRRVTICVGSIDVGSTLNSLYNSICAQFSTSGMELFVNWTNLFFLLHYWSPWLCVAVSDRNLRNSVSSDFIDLNLI